MKLFIVAILSLTLTSHAALAAESSKRDRRDANDVGMWKSYAPKGLRGEFNNHDPIGLMNGQLIKTDCSINYTDPDNKRIYCFNSATALNYFEHWPKTYAKRAADAFASMKRDIPGF